MPLVKLALHRNVEDKVSSILETTNSRKGGHMSFLWNFEGGANSWRVPRRVAMSHLFLRGRVSP